MRKIISIAIAAIMSVGLFNVQAQNPASQDQTENKIRQARFVAMKPKVPSLGIFHYSDLHGDNTAAIKLNALISKYEPYIDVVVNTGDAVHYYAEGNSEYPYDAKWWRGTGLAEKSLFVLGNHDGAMRSNEKGHQEASADWDFMGKEWDYDTFFADYVGGLGCVMPNGYDKPSSPYYKSCFWHKDFADAKIRIIGLDGIHFNDTYRYMTSEQEAWLSARLDDTLDPKNSAYGYSVVIVCHYPIDDFNGDNVTTDASGKVVYNQSPKGGRVMDWRTGDVTNFNFYGKTSYVANKRFAMRAKVTDPAAQYGYERSEVNPLGDIVQSWVNKGGKFVIWLCGHCHTDMLFYSEKYPDLLCLAIDQAGNMRGNGISDRQEDSDSRVCANYYSVDTQNGLFKIVRLGLSIDRLMIPKDVFCYDYLNKKVIYE